MDSNFQDYVLNDCHDLTMLYLNITNITVITVKNVDYRWIIIIHNISKSEEINLLESSVLKNRGYIYIYIYIKYCFNFQSIQDSFSFLLFLFSIYKWFLLWTFINL